MISGSTVYESGLALTLHSYYTLGAAHLPWIQLVKRSLRNSIIVDQASNFDWRIFFLQRPVLRDLDERILMFHSAAFQNSNKHCIELTEVMLQIANEFLSVLQDIRLGMCFHKPRISFAPFHEV